MAVSLLKMYALLISIPESWQSRLTIMHFNCWIFFSFELELDLVRSFKIRLTVYLCMYAHVSLCVHMWVCVIVCVCHQPVEISSLLVGHRDRTEVISLGSNCLHWLSHFSGPVKDTFNRGLKQGHKQKVGLHDTVCLFIYRIKNLWLVSSVMGWGGVMN